ncbi:MAG: dihydropteroate synthase, partial [Candidatus Puniceispirillaceae bacterium]
MSAETSSAPLDYVDSPAQLDYLPDAEPTWLRPVACQPGSALRYSVGEGCFLPLAGGWTGFTELEVITRKPEIGLTKGGFRVWRTDIAGYKSASADKDFAESRLSLLSQLRPDFAGMDMARPHIMGVVNITPDSFSDGGQFDSFDGALSHALQMQADGASLVDIGGESTRPGAAPVSLTEEQSRILPVISALAKKGHIISADTRHAKVMDAAITAGAQIINDVSGFTGEGAVQVMGQAFAARPSAVFGIAMHMQGEPDTIQNQPTYGDVVDDISAFFSERLAELDTAGVARDRILIDPGFGFGKTAEQNFELLAKLEAMGSMGMPVLVGLSRKSMISSVLDR